MRLPANDRFQIVSELGRGGMGAVYRARDLQTGRDVALKVALSRGSDRQRARFQREGELTARLQHPGIVRVHSSGELEGRPYLAYEMVEGEPLSQVLPEVDLRRRIELLRDTARAVGYAHAQGILHRDLKGENVLVDTEGHVHVADFGLATAQDLERLTLTGAMLGTPTHMSPEQVDGRGMGPQTDVWSLGVLLYQALTDQLPFTAGNVPELIGQILSSTTERPSSINPQAPRALESVCLKALSREPADRHAHGEALAAELEAWLEGRLAAPRRPWPWLAGACLLGALAVWGTRGPAGPEPPSAVGRPAPAKSGVAPRPTDAAIRSARRELAKIARLEPEVLAVRARRWLETHAGHPARDRERARALLHTALLRTPLLRIRHHRATRSRPRNPKVFAAFLDDRHLLTQGSDSVLRCWDLEDPQQEVWSLPAGDAQGWGPLSVAPGGAWVAAGVLQGKMRRAQVVRAADGDRRPVPGLPQGIEVKALLFGPLGRHLVVGLALKGVHVYAWPELRLRRVHAARGVRCLAISRDGARLAVGGGGGHPSLAKPMANFVQVWDLTRGALLLKHSPRSTVNALAFAPSGADLVVGDSVGGLYTLGVDDPKRRAAFLRPKEQGTLTSGAHSARVLGIRVSPDGRHVFSVSHAQLRADSTPELRVWSYPDRKQVRHVRRKTPVVSVDLSPNGERLALGSQSGVADVFLAR